MNLFGLFIRLKTSDSIGWEIVDKKDYHNQIKFGLVSTKDKESEMIVYRLIMGRRMIEFAKI